MKSSIFDIDNWKEIGATLGRNKTRTFLTAFGIFWGTAMLTLLLGGAGGLKGMLMRNFDGFATNMGVCFAERTTKAYLGYNKGRQWAMNQNDIDFIKRSCPIIDLSTAMSMTSGVVKAGTKQSAAQLQGMESDYFKISLPILHCGRLINESDVAQSAKVVVLGKNVATALFGDEDPTGKFVSIKNVYFKVVGVVSQTSEVSLGGRLEDSALIPISTMNRTFNKSNDIGALIYTARQGHSPKEIEPYIRRILTTNHYLDPDDTPAIQFMDISENFNMVDNLFAGVSILAFFVGIGTLLAGVIGVGNIMWIIVRERTQEIGIRRAIGAKPRDIIVQVLSESMVLTTVAGLLGICFAALCLYGVDSMTYDPALGSAHFLVSFSTAVGVLLTFIILGTLAGLIPAVKAMKIKPIEALNSK
ncbi:MAG: ABC transporter permease [Bacteroides sp.]|nr:ABC transporter permease [Bacteroides sp.]MCM1413491.1 ABC transporter permease [Bacteroides sp.]MCM1471298.1 ABC transporter permease [Bacteroides sp.]